MGKIHIAARNGDLATVKKLVEEGEYFFSSLVSVDLYERVDLGYGRNHPMYPIEVAAFAGQLEVVTYLHSKGAKWNDAFLYSCRFNSPLCQPSCRLYQ